MPTVDMYDCRPLPKCVPAYDPRLSGKSVSRRQERAVNQAKRKHGRGTCACRGQR